MAYVAPFINSAGLVIPLYQDILDDLIANAKTIYGQDIYLDEDSADYQMLSVFALKIHDTMSSLQLAYNNKTPANATGTALDLLVKLNGISRKLASNSTCIVTLTGVAGSEIVGGQIGDAAGKKWNIPFATIGGGGTVAVTATCQEAGAIAALAGELSHILTPQAGWTSVTNAAAATLGQAIETDAELRVRQTVSTQLSSKSLLGGTVGAIAVLPGVTRYKVYENDTNAVDANGLPEHSITAVVEGGVTADIADAIRINKGIGVYTNGDVSTVVTDPDTGIDSTIRFYRPTNVPIFTTIEVTSLTGWTPNYEDLIRSAIYDFLNGFDIGRGFSPSVLYSPALSVMPNLKAPIFEITSIIAGTAIGTQGTSDIAIAYDEVMQGILENIVINIA